MGDTQQKQAKIIEYIRDFTEEHDYPPTIREIQQGCGISSTSVVDYNLIQMEKRGLIRRDREVARGIELLESGGRRPRVVIVPVLGTIAAGQPIPTYATDTDPDETVEVPPDMVRNRDSVYALRVKGDSMIDALVSDGDVILLQATRTADDGEIVAAWLPSREEATLKKFYREGDRVRLQPKNESMEPIYVDAGDVEIHGKLIGTISTS
jgi:repressor LexA